MNGATLLGMGEKLPWPDVVVRTVANGLVGRTRRRLDDADADEASFARRMSDYPIAINTGEANAQHYEVPAEFFAAMLGPQRKYSCCYYDTPNTTLAQAEERALALTAAHAALADGQNILELGCGWGSLSMWMASSYRNSQILAVSNSHSQRAFIVRSAEAAGLRNLSVTVADMNTFKPRGQFDRIVSVEMFEHMSNWSALLKRVVPVLAPQGRLFIHVFSHRRAPYRFEVGERADWIARHFFTGGIMPSHGLMRQFGDIVEVEQDWRWDGTHYRRTAEHWLENFDRDSGEIDRVLRAHYGNDARLWHRRWRWFLLATAGLFGHRGGQDWGASHYRLKRPTA